MFARIKAFHGAGVREPEKLGRAVGRVCVSLVAMLLAVLIVALFDVPNPNVILITGLSAFTALYGYGAGVACALVTIVYSMYFFSTGHDLVSYTPVDLQKMIVIVVGVVLNTVFIGQLKRKQTEAQRKLEQANALLERENHALEEVSQRDALTGLRNRYALRRDYRRFEDRHLHVMMLDLDDFKGLNDTYGHSVGDDVLRQVGRALMDCFGEDNCYRFGGDEFLVLSEDLEEGDFLARLGKFRERIKALRPEGRDIPVHFSAGYVHGECILSYDLRLMMHQADGSLYEAKGLGKDGYVGKAFSRADAGRDEAARSIASDHDDPFAF